MLDKYSAPVYGLPFYSPNSILLKSKSSDEIQFIDYFYGPYLLTIIQ